MEEANIQVFIPCGGFKDTVNRSNVKDFLENLKELKFIVEGANVFFSDSARRHIAARTKIKHIKDTTANKGGVFSSSIAEVLTGFLMGEDYEAKLLNDTATRWALIKDMLLLVEKFACAETDMLINIHKKNPEQALFALSEKTSEQIFALQALVEERLDDLLKQQTLVWKVMEAYIPAILIKTLGKKQIMDMFDSDKMHAYRDAIITKKIASMAFYRFGLEWDLFLEKVKTDFSGALASVVE
jgi:glutamate dehydrogenase